MNESLLISLPLLGGYYFATVEHRRNYRLIRESGYRLYFAVGIYAVYLVVAASIIVFSGHLGAQVLACKTATTCGPNELKAVWVNFSVLGLYEQLRFYILSLTFVLGRTLAKALNLRRYAKEIAVLEATRNNDFERLLIHGLQTDSPVLFTLRTQKFYLGWVTENPDPKNERRWLRILPMASGVRKSFNHEMHFVTNYLDILDRVQASGDGVDHLRIEDFEVVIRVEDISYAHLFDMAAYTNFYANLNARPN